MFGFGLFKKDSTNVPEKRSLTRPVHMDNKDILAFVIALYQLCGPLLLALLVVGGVLAAVLLLFS